MCNQSHPPLSEGFSTEAALGQTIFIAQESARIHNPYAHEQRKLDCIRRGDEAGLTACQQERWSGEIGRVADEPLRQEKNIALIIIVLASRAAIEGGLPSEFGFTLADTCIRSIEAMAEPETVRQAAAAYELDFCRRVAALPANTTRNAHVNRAKAWIAAHLHEPLSAADVAAVAGVTGGHLSELFRRHEGIALQAYIRRERLRQGEHLLRFSDMTISAIAASLAFSSQSHFCAAFRRETGLTPMAYRDRFARSRNS